MKILGIYGASGFGLEVLQLFIQSNNSFDKIFFIDDVFFGIVKNGIPVVSFEDFLSKNAIEKNIVLAIGSPSVKKRLAAKSMAYGLKLIGCISINAIIDSSAHISSTAIVMPGVVVSANSIIGDHCLLNFNSIIAHDCIVGNFTSISPGVICNGNVLIGECCSIGAAAIIHPGKNDKKMCIEDNVLVGLGSVVLTPVRADRSVFGNPARIMK